MRRHFVLVIGLALLELALPSRAHAWWEFLEQLSGPGPFQGFDLQFRWPCFARTQTIVNGKEVYTIQVAPVTKGGAILTLCKLKDNQTRWGAIDTGYRSLWTNGDVRFADNNSIRFQTVGATFSYNIFNAHPEGDFIDVAAGGGTYWFSSKGFDTFSGVFWEPVRIEFHPTTSFKRNVKWDQYIPVIRAGYFYFPRIEAAKFKAREDIDSDFVLKIGVFWDFQFFR
jgi:hypothetical protein